MPTMNSGSVNTHKPDPDGYKAPNEIFYGTNPTELKPPRSSNSPSQPQPNIYTTQDAQHKTAEHTSSQTVAYFNEAAENGLDDSQIKFYIEARKAAKPVLYSIGYAQIRTKNKSDVYARHYIEQRDAGKNKIYADAYAIKREHKFSRLYAHSYAQSYTEEDRSDRYATIFAEQVELGRNPEAAKQYAYHRAGGYSAVYSEAFTKAFSESHSYFNLEDCEAYAEAHDNGLTEGIGHNSYKLARNKYRNTVPFCVQFATACKNGMNESTAFRYANAHQAKIEGGRSAEYAQTYASEIANNKSIEYATAYAEQIEKGQTKAYACSCGEAKDKDIRDSHVPFYVEQIQLGNSHEFAKLYAQLIAGGHRSEEFVHAYASEKIINKKSIKYATAYAEQIEKGQTKAYAGYFAEAKDKDLSDSQTPFYVQNRMKNKSVEHSVAYATARDRNQNDQFAYIYAEQIVRGKSDVYATKFAEFYTQERKAPQDHKFAYFYAYARTEQNMNPEQAKDYARSRTAPKEAPLPDSIATRAQALKYMGLKDNPNPTQAVVRQKFLHLSRVLHPDKNPTDTNAVHKMQLLNQANTILS